MMLAFCACLDAADWIAGSDLPWERLVTFGPDGFDGYARLRLLPDPESPGQSENDVEGEDWRAEQLPRLFALLAARTATPEDCYFCVWEGFGRTSGPAIAEVGIAEEVARQPGARPALAPHRDTSPGPKLVVPNRAYWLFRGPLAALGAWDAARNWPGGPRLGDAPPAFVWPADRSWCVAHDVDPHWAGIGGPRALIADLIGESTLDAVAADPDRTQPAYR
jgi:hypothetical protein